MSKIDNKVLLEGEEMVAQVNGYVPANLKFRVVSRGDSANEIVNLYGLTVTAQIAGGKTLITNANLGDLLRFAAQDTGTTLFGTEVYFSLPLADGFINVNNGLTITVKNNGANPVSDTDADTTDDGVHVYLYEDSKYQSDNGMAYVYQSDVIQNTLEQKIADVEDEETPWLECLISSNFETLEGKYGLGARFKFDPVEAKNEELAQDDSVMMYVAAPSGVYEASRTIAASTSSATFAADNDTIQHRHFSSMAFSNILLDNEPESDEETGEQVYPYKVMKVTVLKGTVLSLLYKRPVIL